MALIKCCDCGGQVSERALSCPHCGCPIDKIKETSISDTQKIIYDDTVFEIEGTILIKYTGKSDIVIIPDGITTIGYGAFYENSYLKKVTISNSVKTIDELAFCDCKNLFEIAISNNMQCTDMRIIGKGAFDKCGSLKEIIIPNGVEIIEDYAFNECENLQLITIPSSVQSIAETAFQRCYSLTEITVTNGNTQYHSENGILFNKDKTEIVCFPARKEEGRYTIPDGVKTVHSKAFCYCENLTEITIPKSVTKIGDRAFVECNNLKKAYVPQHLSSQISFYTFIICHFHFEIVYY